MATPRLVPGQTVFFGCPREGREAARAAGLVARSLEGERVLIAAPEWVARELDIIGQLTEVSAEEGDGEIRVVGLAVPRESC